MSACLCLLRAKHSLEKWIQDNFYVEQAIHVRELGISLSHLKEPEVEPQPDPLPTIPTFATTPYIAVYSPQPIPTKTPSKICPLCNQSFLKTQLRRHMAVCEVYSDDEGSDCSPGELLDVVQLTPEVPLGLDHLKVITFNKIKLTLYQAMDHLAQDEHPKVIHLPLVACNLQVIILKSTLHN